MTAPEDSPEPEDRFSAGRLASDEPRYALVLVIVLALYVTGSFVERTSAQPVLFALAGVAFVTSVLPDRAQVRTKLLALGAVGVVLAACVLVAIWPTGWRTGVVDIAIALTMLAAGLALIGRFVQRQVITSATVFGAIDVYLLIGLAFAFLYHGLQSWTGDPYFASGIEGTRSTFTYFSFVSLTTLGYGDFVPATDEGRSLAVVEVVLGQILLITVIARLVSLMRLPGRPGPS